MKFKKMIDLDLNDKKVFIRQDFNVPIKNGVITNDARLVASLGTIKHAVKKGAAVILSSHLGRPKEGVYSEEFSLAPIANWLTKNLGQEVVLVKDYLNGNPINVSSKQVVLLENVRFNNGEKSCEEELSKKLANLADIFVMDAFGSAHRAHASTYGIAKYIKVACSGPLVEKEVKNIDSFLQNSKKPVLAVVGGAKVSSKLSILEVLIEKVDTLIVGGGIANTFLAATGKKIGKSLYEEDLIPVCNRILEKAKKSNTSIPLPVDVGVTKEFAETAKCTFKETTIISDDDLILDIGPKTAENYSQIAKQAQAILWNGPVGVFEFDNFGAGTEKIAKAIANSNGFSIAGGGDTIAAIDKYHLHNEISYITTGGGAFLEYVEGKKLPAIAILEERFNQ